MPKPQPFTYHVLSIVMQLAPQAVMKCIGWESIRVPGTAAESYQATDC
jgi:hypothetical protein